MKNTSLSPIVLIMAGIGIGALLSYQRAPVKSNQSPLKTMRIDTTYSDFLPSKDAKEFNVLVLTKKPAEMPYKTPATHFFNEQGTLVVLVAEDNWRYNYFLAIHEITEAMTCIEDRVRTSQMFDFDKKWKYTPGSGVEEPGTDPKCPYRRGHMQALKEERHACEWHGVSWDTYNKAMEEAQQ